MYIGIDASRANKIKKTGIEWYSYHLIQEMKKLEQQELRFILYSKESLRGELAELPKGWESRVLKWPPQRLWTQARFSWEMLKSAPDKLFVPAHTIPLIHPKKTITTLHDIGFEKFPELYGKAELAYHRWSAKFALKHAARIITISNFSKQEMIDVYGADPGRFRVIYNGYNDRAYRVLGEDRVNKVLEKYNLKKPYILFVGRLEEKKNVAGLVRAFDILRKDLKLKPYDLQLALVGYQGYGYEKIKREIRKRGLAGAIKELGWLGEDDLPALHNGAEAFAFPSFYEGFGIPVLEAMACGTPVVASDTTCLPEIVGEAGVLVDPQSPESIARGLNKVLRDKGFREDLIEKGFARVKEFSWEKCARETLEVIREQGAGKSKLQNSNVKSRPN